MSLPAYIWNALLIALPCILIAGFIYRFGLRAIRLDDHPVCRRCRFDLIGVYPAQTQCPECGRSLTHRRAVRTGNRRASKVIVLAAILVLAGGAGGVAFVVWRGAAPADVYRILPTSWLLRETKNATPGNDGAVVELHRRVRAGSVSDRQISKIIDAGLAHQADQASAWVQEWGETLDTLRSLGKMTDEQFHQLLRGGIQADLPLAERYHTNSLPNIQLSVKGGRLPAGLPVRIKFELRSATVGGEAIDATCEGNEDGLVMQLGGFVDWMGSGGHVSTVLRGPSQYAAGIHPIVATYDIEITDTSTGSATSMSRTFAASVEFIDPSASLLRMVSDEQVGLQLADQISANVFRSDATPSSEATMMVTLSCTSINHGVAATVSVRPAGTMTDTATEPAIPRAKPDSSVVVLLDSRHKASQLLHVNAVPEAEYVDVILTHSPAHVSPQSPTQNIYAGTIVIRNVRVKRFGASSAPPKGR